MGKRVKVANRFGGPAPIEEKRMAGRQSTDVLVDGGGMPDETELHVIDERMRINPPVAQAQRGKRANFASPKQFSVLATVEEWFDAEPIARQESALRLGIVKGDRPHSVEPMYRIGPPFDARMKHDFRIAMGDEVRARVDEFTPQVPKIVNFAVEYQREALVPVEHRLTTLHGRILNGQSHSGQANGEFRSGVPKGSDVIRTAMPHRFAAMMQALFLNRLCVERNDSADTAHAAV